MAFEDAYAEVLSSSAVSGTYDEITNKYLAILKQLLPPGPAFKLAFGGVFEKLLQALGHSYERVELRGEDLMREYNPDTMFELLPDWERVFGLPGTNPTPPTTLAGRREAVAAKFVGHGDPSPSNFEAIALAAGYDTVIAAKPNGIFQPFIPGSVAGDSLWNYENGGWPYVWLVMQLTGSDDALLQWLIESVAPQHTFPVFTFYSSTLLDAPFDAWTGNVPDGWAVTEVGGGLVREVGSGENASGTGTGAVSVTCPTGTDEARILQSSAMTTVVGQWYAVIIDVSYAIGTGDFSFVIAGGISRTIPIAKLRAGKRLTFLYQAVGISTAIDIGLDDVTSPKGEVTFDRVRFLGPLNI